MAYCRYPEEVCCNMTLYGGKVYCDNINGFCHLHDELPPRTNADRIRAMSDEELAELFDGIVDNGRSCSLICGDLDNCKRNNSIERICKNHYLKWLKQPAEQKVIKNYKKVVDK